jgi:rhodanese-related sulfurtransferase
MNKLTITIIAVLTITGLSLHATPASHAGQGTRDPQNRDAAYLVPAHSIIQKVKKGQNLTLVDIRSKVEFEKVRITGSINVPIYFIKTKTYLKSKPVILVNAGFARRELMAECRSLSKLGFKVHILDGGLLAWHRKNGRLTGDLTHLQAYTRITPAALHREIDKARIVAVDVSPKSAPEAKELFGGTIHIPYGTQAFTKTMHRKMEKESQARLVVYNQNGEDYLEIRQSLGRKGAHSVFYLEGGLDAYKKYTENYALLYKTREERLKSTSCNNCGPVKKE